MMDVNVMGDILFGVSGYPKHFLESELGKNREQIFAWLHSLGLQAFLLDWTYGTAMSEKRAKKYCLLARENRIYLVLRAPRDIDFISQSKRVRQHSKRQLERACLLANQLDCSDIIVHLGSSKVEDKYLLEKRLVRIFTSITLRYPTIRFHIEPAIKKTQWGSLDEVISLCQKVPHLVPSFNLMRLHACSGCTIIYPGRIVSLLKKIETALGRSIFDYFCVTICPISYEHGKFVPKTFGEVKVGQLSFFESNFEYFPKASDYIQAIRKLQIHPITFSMTPETEEIGAMRLRDSYFYQKTKEREL